MTDAARKENEPGDFGIGYEFGGGWYLILPDGSRGEQSFANSNAALSAKGRAVRKAADASLCRDRACITCKTMFPSQGPHHRMCLKCRHNSPDADPVRPYITGRR